MDAGATWTATSLTQATGALAIAPETLITPITVYAGTGSGLFISVDGGTKWSPAGVPDQLCSVEIDLAIPTTLVGRRRPPHLVHLMCLTVVND